MSKLPVIDSSSQRGVKNPKVVDLIIPSRDRPEVALVMIEDRPWSNQPEQILELEEKLNNYLDYVLDGFFEADYPEYKELSVCIRLEHLKPPSGSVKDLIDSISQYLQGVGIRFESAELSTAE